MKQEKYFITKKLIIVFGVFIFFTNIPEYTFVMRLWLILLIISWIIDLSWMIIYTGVKLYKIH